MNDIKRTISLLLFIGFLCFNKILAQTNPCPIYSTSPECITAAVGDTIEIDIIVEGMVNMRLVRFALSTDFSLIQPIEILTPNGSEATLTNIDNALQPPAILRPEIVYPFDDIEFFILNTNPLSATPITYTSSTHIFSVPFIITGTVGSTVNINLDCYQFAPCQYAYIDPVTNQGVNDLSDIKVNGETTIYISDQNQNPVCCDADNGTLSSGN